MTSWHISGYIRNMSSFKKELIAIIEREREEAATEAVLKTLKDYGLLVDDPVVDL